METQTRFRGDQLRKARKARNISQTGLADRIGASWSSITRWERGVNAPSGRHVAALCRELGISTEQLYDEEDDEEAALDPYLALRHQLSRIADALEARGIANGSRHTH